MKQIHPFAPETQQAIDNHTQSMAESIRATFTNDTQQAILFHWDSGSSSTHYIYYNNQGNWKKEYIDSVNDQIDDIQNLIKVKQSFIYYLQVDTNTHKWNFTKDINPEIDMYAIGLFASQQFGIDPEDDYERQKLAKAEKQETIKKTLAYACYQDNMETFLQMLPQAKPTAIEKKIKLIGSPLHSAVINNNIPMIEHLVQAGANIESTDYMRFTPLLHAIDLGHEEVARKLIQLGADISKRGAQNNSALSLAVTCKALSRSFLDLLVQKGCNVNDTIIDKINLLVLAANSNPEGVQFLLDNNIDPTSLPEAIRTACSHSNIEILDILIPVGGIEPLNVNHSDVLYQTITWKRMEMIKYLLGKGVSFYEIPEKPVKLYYNKPIKYKESPCEWAGYLGLTEIAQLLENRK